MTIMARYINSSGDVVTAFIGLVDLPDGKAITINDALHTFLTEKGLVTNTLNGLSSDGAAVVVGKRGGVATLLKREYPELVNIHCVAHRLALASAQSTDNIS